MNKSMMASPVETVEQTIHNVVNYIWATMGKIESDKFDIGVGWDHWCELGGDAATAKMEFPIHSDKFQIILVPGLPPGKVALIWR